MAIIYSSSQDGYNIFVEVNADLISQDGYDIFVEVNADLISQDGCDIFVEVNVVVAVHPHLDINNQWDTRGKLTLQAGPATRASNIDMRIEVETTVRGNLKDAACLTGDFINGPMLTFALVYLMQIRRDVRADPAVRLQGSATQIRMDVRADPAVLQRGSICVREDPAVLLHGSIWPLSIGFPNPVRDTQNVKAQIRVAQKKTQLLNDQDIAAADHPWITTIDAVLTMDNGAVLTMDNDLPCPCNSPTLQTLETLAGLWRKEWASENVWNEAYNEALGRAQTKGERETTIFLNQCTQHAWEGRTLLDSIRDVVHTSCLYCREHLKYDTILLYDLLVDITAEVKFFEVKLDTCCN
ncbi:hypothetical protein DFH29DRAFT_1050001 [Suillus ampliporus]|nr:hypothetical protein DFH29DRAFT_1050001 [Suillus ampliporus]